MKKLVQAQATTTELIEGMVGTGTLILEHNYFVMLWINCIFFLLHFSSLTRKVLIFPPQTLKTRNYCKVLAPELWIRIRIDPHSFSLLDPGAVFWSRSILARLQLCSPKFVAKKKVLTKFKLSIYQGLFYSQKGTSALLLFRYFTQRDSLILFYIPSWIRIRIRIQYADPDPGG